MSLTFNGADLILYVLVLARVAGIATSGPVFGEQHVPTQVRVGIAAMMALVAFPSVRSAAQGPELQTLLVGSPALLFVLVLKETLVGLVVGYMAKLLFYALQMAAYLVDFQMGLGMAAVYDPSLGGHTSPIGSLVNWVALMVFLALNGHHRLIEVLVGSFQRLPLGWAWTGGEGAMLGAVVKQIAYTTQVALGLFAPLLVVLGVTELALGIISKAAPQMNILMVSMPLKIWIGIVGLLLWIGTLSGPLGHAFGLQLSGLPGFLRLLGR